MYEFSVDHEKRRIAFRVSGFSNPTQAVAFDTDLRAHVRAFKDAGLLFDIFADLREAAILSKDYSQAISRQMGWVAEQGLRKAAHVVTSALYQLQLKRLAPDSRSRFFTDEREALDWLDDQ